MKVLSPITVAALALLAGGCSLLYDTDDLRPGPYVESISPERALFGQGETIEVTIRGSGFVENPTVRLDSEEIRPKSVREDEIVIEIPDDYQFGGIAITVFNRYGGWTVFPGFHLYSDTVAIEAQPTIEIAGSPTWNDHQNGFITDMGYDNLVGGDNVKDLAVVLNGQNFGEPGAFIVLEGQDDGSFIDRGLGAATTSEDHRAMAIADLNGDDDNDVVLARVCCGESTADILYGNGDGFAVEALASDQIANSGAVAVALIDNRGDGSSEIVINRSTVAGLESVEVFSEDDGEFRSVGLYEPAPGYAANSEPFVFGDSLGNVIAVADFDLDGNDDVVLPLRSLPSMSNADVPVSVHGIVYIPGTSSRETLDFDEAQIETLRFDEPGGWKAMQAVDIDTDNRPDLVGLRDSANNELWTLRGTAFGAFEYEEAITVLEDSATDIALADVNGDGRMDVWACESEVIPSEIESARLYLGQDDGTFDPTPAQTIPLAHVLTDSPPAPAATHCGDLVTGDFDGDGLPDLAVGVGEKFPDKTVNTETTEEWKFTIRVFLNTSDEP